MFVKRFTNFLTGSMLVITMVLPILKTSMVSAAPTNLIANPLVETVNPSNANAPASWLSSSWGTNTTNFSYLNTGSTGDTNSVNVQTTSYTSGDSKWYFSPVAVTAGTEYTYNDFYQSTTASEIDVAYTMSDGSQQYVDLGDPSASSSWTQFSANFTAPTGVVNATIYHLINSVGSLTSDNFDLSATSTPTVSLTAPTASSAVSGKSVVLSANASDLNAVASVQFQVDGTNVGAPVTTAPYSYNWDSTTVANGAHSITAQATNTEGITTTSAPEEITVDNVIPLGTNLILNPLVETATPGNASAPNDWQTGSWGTNTSSFSYLSTGSTGDNNSVSVQTTSYTSGDSKWYFNPVSITAGDQYTFSDYYQSTTASEIDVAYTMSDNSQQYVDLGDLSASSGFKQFSASFTAPAGAVSATIYHEISSVGTLTTDNFSLTPSSTPSIVVASPSASSTVSGTTVQLLANAADAGGIKSVQFEVDGTNVGSPLTTAPYDYNWDSTTVANGTHFITAVATNTEGVTTTSATVSVTVNNTVAAGTNVIPNPLLETVNPSNSSDPLDWTPGTYGTNTTNFSYLSTGSTGDTSSVKVQTTAFTSGSSEWMYNAQNVVAGDTYNFSDYYESTIATNVEVEFISSTGTDSYLSLGSPATSSTWKQFSGSFIVPTGTVSAVVYQYLNAVGSLTTDNYSLTISTAPTVTLTAPAASTATSTPYSGNLTLSANASDYAGVTNVQFEVDGVKVGSPVTTAPYSLVWNSATVSNGTHSITAIVTGGDGKTTTSAAVSVEISNASTTSGNLIPNPLMTTVSPTNTADPQDWSVATWGTNTFTSSYLSTGSTGDSRSVEINMTKYTSGDAKWIFTPQAVAQDTQYQFTDEYESNVQTLVDAVFTMSDGTTEYEIIGIPYAATTWTQFSTKFSVPEGAVNVTIYHLIQSVGTLTIDNASMTPYTPSGFTRPIVTLTFDDGYSTAYTNALPILKADGFTATAFIITDLIGKSGYMTAAQLKTFAADGDEMASHTVTHDNLTLETAAALKTEMTQSQTTIKTDTGVSPTDMAYPYGLYNAAAVTATKAVYTAARGVESGLNSKDNYNAYDLKVENIYTTTTTAQVTDWLAQAKATNTWLIFVYHGVDTNLTTAVDSDEWCVTPAQLTAQLAAVKASGLTVETMAKGIAEVTPQL
jgi:peptidoglycan/xylan/chitin deacetylase (PgdA/CDA1 family)